MCDTAWHYRTAHILTYTSPRLSHVCQYLLQCPYCRIPSPLCTCSAFSRATFSLPPPAPTNTHTQDVCRHCTSVELKRVPPSVNSAHAHTAAVYTHTKTCANILHPIRVKFQAVISSQQMSSTSALNWDQRVTPPVFNLSASERQSCVMRQTSSRAKSKTALLMLQHGVAEGFLLLFFRLKEH